MIAIALASALGCDAPRTTINNAPPLEAARTPTNELAPSDADLALSLVEEADTPCAPHPEPAREVVAADARPPGFVRLTKVSDRWVAEARYALGFALIDSAGAGPIVSLGEWNRIAADESGVAVVALTEPGDVVFGRFDREGRALGASLTIASDDPNDLAIGKARGRSLAIWSTTTGVRARGVDETGQPLGPSFALESDAPKDMFHASIVESGDGAFAVHWSERAFADGHFGSHFALTTGTALADVHRVFRTGEPHAAIALARTADGFVSLIDHGRQTVPVLVPLDRAGRLAGPGHALTGARAGLGLAVRGDELGVVAIRNDSSIAFRAFDTHGRALSAWSCLTMPSDRDVSAAIAADGDGYSVLFPAPDGGQRLVHVASAVR